MLACNRRLLRATAPQCDNDDFRQSSTRALFIFASYRIFTLQLAAIQKVMAKFGITELARTGRVALKRGEALLSNSLPEGVAHTSPESASR